jgi:subtilase family serine protease
MKRDRRLALALLGSAVVVAGCTGSPARPAATTTPGAATPVSTVSGCLVPPATCYAPRLLRVAYGVQALLAQGINGRGETVTVLDPALPSNDPVLAGTGPQKVPSPQAQGIAAADISRDLAAFDIEFGLPAAPVKVVTSPAGGASSLQATYEEVQDLEIVHAIAPAAALRVVLVPSDVADSPVPATVTAGMLTGLRQAVSGTDVAVIGWSLGEHFFTRAQAAQMHSLLLGAEASHVTVIAASGDNGAFSQASLSGTAPTEVSLPASDPLVLSVGGTTLTANPLTGTYTSETVWNGHTDTPQSIGASGGGFSHLYARPSYQDGVAGTTATRGVPDVAADGDPNTGASVISVTGGPGTAPAAGTAAAAALWAGLMALADQDAHHDLGFVNPAIYRIASGSSYHQAFHDVTTGNNVQTQAYPGGTAGYKAGPGWSPATGWGSPNAQVLIPLLAG